MKIHFIGIGGIGVSALAQYYLANGYEVSGSDLASSEITEYLKNKGVKIFNFQLACRTGRFSIFNFQKQKLPDLVIYSPAVEKSNLELREYMKAGIKCQSYPEALGELAKKYFTIAVSGAHGKSTTTSMLALVLVKAGFDPTVIVGTKLKEFGDSNFRQGKSKYLVIEACEYEDAFLNYYPQMIVLTNIDREHLDYFHNLKNILKSFANYISHLPNNGYLIYNGDDKNINKIFNSPAGRAGFQFSTRLPDGQVFNFQTKKYSLKQKEVKEIKKILQIPGTHNVYNALAVLEASRALGIDDKITFEALSEYKGSWRRFEESQFQNSKFKIQIINDYGHHPNEVKATLQAAREKYPKEKIWCVFQPHQYQRTFFLFNDFVKILRQAQDNYLINKIIVTDIYTVAGRETEEIKKKVSSEKLVKKINKKSVIYAKQDKLEDYLSENIKEMDILIIMGAGDIYGLSDSLIKEKR